MGGAKEFTGRPIYFGKFLVELEDVGAALEDYGSLEAVKLWETVDFLSLAVCAFYIFLVSSVAWPGAFD